jgi:hypothetical protein
MEDAMKKLKRGHRQLQKYLEMEEEIKKFYPPISRMGYSRPTPWGQAKIEKAGKIRNKKPHSERTSLNIPSWTSNYES